MRLLPVPLLLILAAPAWAQSAPGTSFRLSGQDQRGGPCTGTLTLDGAEVDLALDVARGPARELRGTARRVGTTLVLDVSNAGAATRVTITPSADRVALTWSGGERGAASGPRLDWTREADLDPRRPNAGRLGDILRHYQRARQTGVFAGVGGSTIAWAAFPSLNERAAVVVSTGRTESYEKYPELIYDLRRLGFSLFFIEHRGQGRSARLLSDRQKQYVRRWSDYVDDLEAFVRQIVRPASTSGKIVGLGHSMGGGILTDVALRRPRLLRAVVLSAPMLQLDLSWLDRRIVDLMVLIGRGERYARGQGPWSPADWDAFADNRTTTSRVRYQLKRQLWDALPTLWIGGPTYRWVREVNRGTKSIRRRASQLTTPTLLFQAGAEALVANAGQDEVARKAPRLTKVAIPRGKHELLFEADPIRHRVLTRIIRFLDHHTR